MIFATAPPAAPHRSAGPIRGLGRHADVEAIVAKAMALFGYAPAYQYARIYARWENRATALARLETALRLRDGDLGWS